MDAKGFEVVCRGLADTEAVAALVAGLARRGDAILLDGKLAAGKTHFVKAFVRALGSTDAVTSLTYAIAHFYDTGIGRVLHIDAYRLSGPAEFRDLGFDGYFAEVLTVIEWGHIVAEEFADHLAIDLKGRRALVVLRIPMGRFGHKEEAAALVAWLCSEDCSFSTGAVFDLSGGRATY